MQEASLWLCSCVLDMNTVVLNELLSESFSCTWSSLHIIPGAKRGMGLPQSSRSESILLSGPVEKLFCLHCLADQDNVERISPLSLRHRGKDVRKHMGLYAFACLVLDISPLTSYVSGSCIHKQPSKYTWLN